MIYDGKISKLSPHPFKDGYYVGEILTDGGRGCVFELNPRRAKSLDSQFTREPLSQQLVGLRVWVEIAEEKLAVLDWGV